MRLEERLGPKHLPLPTGPQGDSPVGLLLRRAADRSTRGARTDGRVLALAIEGGGLSGAVSAGMCVILEAAGVIDAVDVIYGTSSGALNGSFTAAGQAAIGSTNYEDTANRRFSNPMRLLVGRPAVDFDLLFDDIIRNRKPYDPTALETGPPFRALGVNLKTRALEVLRDFEDIEDLMAAVRVSCSLPLLSGPPVVYKGVPMADGGLIESMPYRTAQGDGATDVIVLRSRPASYRKEAYPRYMISILKRRAHPALADLVEARPGLYNAEADELETLTRTGVSVVQIVPAEDSPRVSQTERSPTKVRAGLQAGARAAAVALQLPQPELFWQPAVYVGGRQHAVEPDASMRSISALDA
jgi:predicted patatin/cPLA2 family phospholipase